MYKIIIRILSTFVPNKNGKYLEKILLWEWHAFQTVNRGSVKFDKIRITEAIVKRTFFEQKINEHIRDKHCIIGG